ncbi:hypothetical protein P691DRAFT_781838 [Macrolepiota fuliginosa MF-IS2]|uniref:Uncharacterized protein n=1 Tax=Macrolepiota fuliginosa MF-IS2 TaxID=1400762 RepID=A0A9P6BWD0_9AGAR|nr:hypothetical protein P691DRAFT_781838 [Macrolepiota fuliginosa MF-IS2]
MPGDLLLQDLVVDSPSALYTKYDSPESAKGRPLDVGKIFGHSTLTVLISKCSIWPQAVPPRRGNKDPAGLGVARNWSGNDLTDDLLPQLWYHRPTLNSTPSNLTRLSMSQEQKYPFNTTKCINYYLFTLAKLRPPPAHHVQAYIITFVTKKTNPPISAGQEEYVTYLSREEVALRLFRNTFGGGLV